LNDKNELIDTTRLYSLNSVAVHLALLKTGKIILFSGHHEHIWNWNRGESSLWDPKNPKKGQWDPKKPKENLGPKLKRNLFCSGHCFLPDGRLFAAGGQSTFNHPVTIPLSVMGIIQPFVNAADHDIHTFDPDSQTWKRHELRMPKARWYPTCVTLPDGKTLIVSGTSSHAHHELFGGFMNLDYEIFDHLTDTLSKPVKFIDKIKMYPFLQVLPGGMLFVHSEVTTQFWNIAKKEFIPNVKIHTRSSGTRTYPGSGSCVLLPLEPDSNTAKILLIGGSTTKNPNVNTDATKLTEILEVNLKNPAKSEKWEILSTHIPRFLCDSILLPDGTVLVTNGAAKGTSDDNQNAVTDVELFDPSKKTWEVIAYLKRERLYHCSAVLMLNGQVVVAGSTGENWVRSVFAPQEHFEHEIEIITPPKLKYNPDRPELKDAPDSISYNTIFEVTKNDVHIEKVSLIKSSSTTHNNNMDQRCIVLPIKEQTKNALKLLSPKDSTYAPPGYYMLFILDEENVPSVGKFVKVS